MPTVLDVRSALAKGDKKEASRLLEAILRDEPTADAWYMAAQMTSNEDTAVKYLRRALMIDPDHRLSRDMMRRLGGTDKSASGIFVDEFGTWLRQQGDRSPILKYLSPSLRLVILVLLLVGLVGAVVAAFSYVQDNQPEPIPEIGPTAAPQQFVTSEMVLNTFRNNGINVYGVERIEDVRMTEGSWTRFSVSGGGAVYTIELLVYDTLSDLFRDQERVSNTGTNVYHLYGNALLGYPPSMDADFANMLKGVFELSGRA